jgi:hypothetical protein
MMIILVAAVAQYWDSCKLQLCYWDLFIFSAVTWTARNGRMLSFKSKLSSGVIKRYELPAFDFMAKLTSPRRDRFVDRSFVNILMTNLTLCRSKRKLLFRLHRHRRRFTVAEIAGHGKMRALKRIFGLLMQSHREIRRDEATNGMTFFAGALGLSVGELSVVKIGVAIEALTEFQSLYRLTALVTLIAGDRRVLAN